MSATTPQVPAATRTFTQLLSSTRRGARLARLLTTECCRAWEAPAGVTEHAEQVVAELAANAALHGRVQGRDFRLTLTFDRTADRLHIAVTDARADLLPTVPAEAAAEEAESGRGLLIVAALADDWGTESYPPSGKTVWAVIGPRGGRHRPG
ncbi:ATP-binding protein [Streptomyces sp. NPDC096080]|uniref:ATP-binding protein n=1 Tax=Streptomyces sp. NPDC096080 TaxID=3156693 RepID=UPI00332E59E0